MIMPDMMRRPLVCVALAWTTGMVLAPSGVIFLTMIGMFVLGLTLVLFATQQKQVQHHRFLLPVGLLLLVGVGGFTHARTHAWNNAFHRREIVASSLQHTNIVSGLVGSSPRSHGPYQSFELLRPVIHQSTTTVQQPSKLLVLTHSLPEALEVGSGVMLSGSLQLIRGPAFAGDLDSRQYYAARGIFAQLWVNEHSPIKIQPPNTHDWYIQALRVLSKIQTYIRSTLYQYLAPDLAAIAQSFFLGDRSQLNTHFQTALSHTGVMHITAVSGLHVTLLAYTALLPLKPLFLLGISRRRRQVIVVFVVLLLAAVAGFKVPAVRAVIIGAVFHLGALFKRQTDPLNSLALALLIILIGWPQQLFQVGFLLSFCTVSAIILFSQPLSNIFERLTPQTAWIPGLRRYSLHAIALSLAAFAGSWPILMSQFHVVSLTGMLANIFVVPCLTLVMAGLMVLFVAALLGAWCALPIAFGLSFAIQLLRAIVMLFAEYGTFLIMRSTPNIEVICFYYVALCILIQPQQYFPLRYLHFRLTKFQLVLGLAVLTILLGLFLTGHQLVIDFVDVGQGDAIFVRAPCGMNLLVDTGPPYRSAPNRHGPIIKHLRAQGVHTLDAIVITHADIDHIGQLPELIQEFSVRNLFFGLPPDHTTVGDQVLQIANTHKIPVQYIVRGQALQGYHQLTSLVLNPAQEDVDTMAAHTDDNENSIVLWLVYKNITVLLTGDISSHREENLLRLYPGLRATILKPAHHGSRFSTSQAFVNHLQPQIAVLCVGRNTYGHPHPTVLKRLQHAGVLILRTDQHATIRVVTDGQNYEVAPWRDGVRYFETIRN